MGRSICTVYEPDCTRAYDSNTQQESNTHHCTIFHHCNMNNCKLEYINGRHWHPILDSNYVPLAHLHQILFLNPWFSHPSTSPKYQLMQFLLRTDHTIQHCPTTSLCTPPKLLGITHHSFPSSSIPSIPNSFVFSVPNRYLDSQDELPLSPRPLKPSTEKQFRWPSIYLYWIWN